MQVLRHTADPCQRTEDVWYMGEDTKQFKNGVVVGTAGTWLAGVDAQRPGFVMEGQPAEGDAYRQESSPGVAEDNAQVVSLTGSVSRTLWFMAKAEVPAA